MTTAQLMTLLGVLVGAFITGICAAASAWINRQGTRDSERRKIRRERMEELHQLLSAVLLEYQDIIRDPEYWLALPEEQQKEKVTRLYRIKMIARVYCINSQESVIDLVTTLENGKQVMNAIHQTSGGTQSMRRFLVNTMLNRYMANRPDLAAKVNRAISNLAREITKTLQIGRA